MSLKSFLLDLWKKGTGENKKRNVFMLLLFSLGILLMFGSSFFAPQQERFLESEENFNGEQFNSLDAVDKYEREIKRSLRDVLEHVKGISNVQVFIKLSDGKESVYARDTEEIVNETIESDTQGGSREVHESNVREEYVIIREGGGDSPLLKKEKMPAVKGVIVVAEGLSNSELRYEVMRAIQSALDVPLHRISVLPLGEE